MSEGAADGGGASPEDVEPDYRFTLANERTFLAWIRTSLAIIAGAIGLKAIMGSFSAQWLALATAFAAAALGGVLPIIAWRHWQTVQTAMRRGEPLPVQRGVIVLTTAIVVLAAALAVAVLL